GGDVAAGEDVGADAEAVEDKTVHALGESDGREVRPQQSRRRRWKPGEQQVADEIAESGGDPEAPKRRAAMAQRDHQRGQRHEEVIGEIEYLETVENRARPVMLEPDSGNGAEDSEIPVEQEAVGQRPGNPSCRPAAEMVGEEDGGQRKPVNQPTHSRM